MLQNKSIQVFETSAQGRKLEKVDQFEEAEITIQITLNPEKKFQTITGIGGSFTEASAHLLTLMSEGKRREILKAYFSEEGSRYSLTRTHINSCDVSLSHYSYDSNAGDVSLQNFSIERDRKALIPMIKEAKTYSKQGFKIIASPWTAPPWMKDNQSWVGGKLLPEYYPVWADFFEKYLQAFQDEGIAIWGLTVENEPHGNGNNWESMHFSPEEMTDFVRLHLGPKLENKGWKEVKILGYDQNREGLKEWVDVMFANAESSKYFSGTAVHWYESTYEVFPEALQYAHHKAPEKFLIQTEACIDAEVPRWQDDDWYWSKEAKDWGWLWAPENQKYLHPQYVPVYRYAVDIIGCFNNWVDGWIDWNMVLDRRGGPNWFENWCVAPVIVDPSNDEVYYTPLYYILAHFSKFIRPGSKIIEVKVSDDKVQATAAKNEDGSLVLVVLNQNQFKIAINLEIADYKSTFSISPAAIQTIIIGPDQTKTT